LFDNEKATLESILRPHRDATRQRMVGQPRALLVQDTTELDFNGQAIEGLGPLSYEAQRGLYLHPTVAVTPERLPLGVLDAWMWAREAKKADGTRPGLPESLRWQEGYERMAEYAQAIPATRWVYVADREATSWLDATRPGAGQSSGLADPDQAAQTGSGRAKLWEQAAQAPWGSSFLPAAALRRRGRVVQELRCWRTFTRRETRHVRSDGAVGPKSIRRPGKPLEWRLLSNRLATLWRTPPTIDCIYAAGRLRYFQHSQKRLQSRGIATVDYRVSSWRWPCI
jgi:hypothetical protein